MIKTCSFFPSDSISCLAFATAEICSAVSLWPPKQKAAGFNIASHGELTVNHCWWLSMEAWEKKSIIKYLLIFCYSGWIPGFHGWQKSSYSKGKWIFPSLSLYCCSVPNLICALVFGEKSSGCHLMKYCSVLLSFMVKDLEGLWRASCRKRNRTKVHIQNTALNSSSWQLDDREVKNIHCRQFFQSGPWHGSQVRNDAVILLPHSSRFQHPVELFSKGNYLLFRYFL